MDAREIAAGLTDTQRRLIMALGPDFRDWGARGTPGNRKSRMAVEHLTEAGKPGFMKRLTPLGLEVRSILTENAG